MDNHGGVARILDILRSYFAPEAADAIHQQLMRLMQLRSAEQRIDEFIAEFDLLRRKAETKLEAGRVFPG